MIGSLDDQYQHWLMQFAAIDIAPSYFDQVIGHKSLKQFQHTLGLCIKMPICGHFFTFMNHEKEYATAYLNGYRAHRKWPSVPQKMIYLCVWACWKLGCTRNWDYQRCWYDGTTL